MHRARTTAVAAATLVIALSTTAEAQRGARGGSLPRVTTAPRGPIATSGPRGSAGSRPSAAGVPRGGPGIRWDTGDLPRLETAHPRRPGSRAGDRYDPRYDPRTRSRFGTGIGTRFGTAVTRRPLVRSKVISGCGFGGLHCSCGIRGCKPFTFIGVPFGFAVAFPFVYESYSSSYITTGYAGDPDAFAEAPRSRVIVVGAGGASDQLSVESLGDSVRLTWIGAGKPAREVRLFLTDSAQNQLASRSASAANPRATFEVRTLSAPVAFVGVTVVFTDGVSSTTVVPYRREERK